MRLSVFLPTSSTQLLIDLHKIYQNYFTEEQLTNQALEKLVESKDSQLYATMFNERHLGAVQVTVNKTQAQLSLLTIRDLTRRRGIAKNLLREVEKQLKAEGVSIIKMTLDDIKQDEQPGLIVFMQVCGYQFSENAFSKSI